MDDTDTSRHVLVHRWQRHVDVCAVLTRGTVTWIARDILDAVEGDPGDYADDPGHDPLVVAEHKWARTWTLPQARTLIAGSIPGDSLLHWMRQHEIVLAAIGHGNIVRLAAHGSPLDGPVHTVTDAAARLNRDPSIDTGMRRLFDWLLVQQWITRRGDQYAPTQSALDQQLLAVAPARKPHDGDPWPQIVLTDLGLTELHARMGGTDPTVLGDLT